MYHTDSDALGGVVKLRYWDFVVQEMYTENGKQQTAQIVDFEVPQTDFNKLPENTNNYDFLYVDVQKMNTDLQKNYPKKMQFLNWFLTLLRKTGPNNRSRNI